ncbi:MAG: sulfatase [Balneolales bacterium]
MKNYKQTPFEEPKNDLCRPYLKNGWLGIAGLASMFLLLPLMQACAPVEADKQPNIVFIMTDDQGWNQVGYHGFDQFYETPNIDRIAQEGMHFREAYSASSICSPARVSVMTGKNPARLHLTDYIPGGLFPYKPLASDPIKQYLPIDQKVLPQLLKENGYATALFGKWHLSPDRRFGEPGRFFDAMHRGFDEVLHNAKPPADHDPFDDPHHVEDITQHSLDFLERNQDKPFFMMTSHHVVHRPLIEEPELIRKYEEKPGSELDINNPIMGAMIERMDHGIGRILDKLDELNLTENTIIVFFSDNGGLELLQSQEPLRGGKAMVFEGGIRVPMIVKWTGEIEPGSVSHEPVISDDLFPTLLDLASIRYDAPELDGISMMPLLKQESEDLGREALYWHYPHYHHLGYKPGGAIRMGDYKLIEWYEETAWGLGNQISLYNLRDDVGETVDLSDKHPELAVKMRRMLHEWRLDIDAQEMRRNPHYDPERADVRLGAM